MQSRYPITIPIVIVITTTANLTMVCSYTSPHPRDHLLSYSIFQFVTFNLSTVRELVNQLSSMELLSHWKKKITKCFFFLSNRIRMQSMIVITIIMVKVIIKIANSI